jgi:hypothetical protein
MSDNLEILIFKHIKKVVPKPEDLLFTRKKGSSKKDAVQGHVQNGLQSVHPDPFPPTL